jgi:PAS domain S-box-containing protein
MTLTVTYWNKGAETVFGYKADEVMGKNARDLFRNKVDHAYGEAIIAQTEAAGHWDGEVKYKRKNGDYAVCKVSLAGVKDA